MADNSTILVLGVDMKERLRWTWALERTTTSRRQQQRPANGREERTKGNER